MEQLVPLMPCNKKVLGSNPRSPWSLHVLPVFSRSSGFFLQFKNMTFGLIGCSKCSMSVCVDITVCLSVALTKKSWVYKTSQPMTAGDRHQQQTPMSSACTHIKFFFPGKEEGVFGTSGFLWTVGRQEIWLREQGEDIQQMIQDWELKSGQLCRGLQPLHMVHVPYHLSHPVCNKK